MNIQKLQLNATLARIVISPRLDIACYDRWVLHGVQFHERFSSTSRQRAS